MPTATLLIPGQLDLAAAALYDTAAWQQIVTGWNATASQPTATEATEDPQPPAVREGDWRRVLTVPVDQLMTTALVALPPAPPAERPLPGRLGAALPDRLHTWRRIGQGDVRPSVHLAYARQILDQWSWLWRRRKLYRVSIHSKIAVRAAALPSQGRLSPSSSLWSTDQPPKCGRQARASPAPLRTTAQNAYAAWLLNFAGWRLSACARFRGPAPSSPVRLRWAGGRGGAGGGR